MGKDKKEHQSQTVQDAGEVLAGANADRVLQVILKGAGTKASPCALSMS